MEKKLKKYLDYLIKHQGSDLHLKAGSNVYMRVNGELFALKEDKLTHDDMVAIAKDMLTTPQYNQLVESKELDCSYALDETKRFRVNFFYQVGGLSAALRAIPEKILSIDELHLPEVVKDLADLQSGLVLVTGVTGSGKSTTLAAMLDRINKSKRKHIISIEDPVEYMHKEQKSLVTQRAIGTNTHSFANALRSALREDIDIIFIGELRDLETMEIALHAANTGHLVFSTLHTLDAKESISRIIGMFPNEEQERIRMTLSFVLEGVISQRLVKDKEGGRVPAVEVMKGTARISELIVEKRDSEILEAIVKGKEIYGTQSFDQSLLDLYHSKKITQEEALRNATSPSDMSLAIQGIRQASGHENVKSITGKGRSNFFDLKNSQA
ncbi:Twitching motility protein PilT [hydrothermal vent metagenome]|uniref:Twitching motility protein PilT n=1 Tax=hydrothermal vent metagenome TaxID=652676 RepID=A0A1W1BSL6_9ZZZZ